MRHIKRRLLSLLLLTFLPITQVWAQTNTPFADVSTLLDLSLEEHAQRQKQATGLTPVGYQLNAMKPDVLANFYSHMLGMHVIEADETTQYYALGNAAGEVLLEIFPATIEKSRSTTGLYHGAFLFTSEVAFGTTLAHLLENKAPMQGYSDHGFSKAAYLGDIEGNSIELYLDTPSSTWQSDQYGYKQGGNEALDITPYLLQRTQAFNGFGEDVTMGHFHLSVSDIRATELFYGEILGLAQSSAPTTDTAFFASGDYHHYLGTNNWTSEDAPAPSQGLQGLRATIWQVSSSEDITYIIEQLDAHDIAYENNEQEISLLDNSGLQVIIRK